MAGYRLFLSPHPLPLLHSLLIRDFKGHGEGEIGRLCLPTWVLCSRRRCRLWVASGGSPRLVGHLRFFALAATVWGRRQSGFCGFAARGIFVGGLQRQCECEFERGGGSGAAGLSPGPSPSLRFWGGVFVWLLDRGIGRLCRFGLVWVFARPAHGLVLAVGLIFWLGFGKLVFRGCGFAGSTVSFNLNPR